MKRWEGTEAKQTCLHPLYAHLLPPIGGALSVPWLPEARTHDLQAIPVPCKEAVTQFCTCRANK